MTDLSWWGLLKKGYKLEMYDRGRWRKAYPLNVYVSHPRLRLAKGQVCKDSTTVK